jgi:AraC-like DNA-binding protein
MNYIALIVPPFPYFVHAGTALYRPGDCHRRRSNLKVFDAIFVEYGCLHMTDGNHSYQLKENDILILHPNHTHFGHKNCSKETYFHWFHFYTTGEFTYSSSFKSDSYDPFKSNMYALGSTKIIVPTFQTLPSDKAATLLNLLKQAEMVSIDKYHPEANTLLNRKGTFYYQELLMRIFSLLILNVDTTTHNAIAYSAMNYMLSHYSENITLDVLAVFLSVHPVHIIRCMKKEYGMTPNQLLTDIRIKTAKKHLLDPVLSCSEVADLVGFASSSYFSRVFKQAVGVTPQEYRTSPNAIPDE